MLGLQYLSNLPGVMGVPSRRDMLAQALRIGATQVVPEADSIIIDPLRRLLDPAFTNVLWLYEYSKTEPEIPGMLHSKQIEILHSTARHRWLFWGNQVGKTTIGAVDCVLLALGRHPVQTWKPPVKIWASALTWELWENILLPELLTWIPVHRLIDAPPAGAKSTKRVIRILADNGTISTITGKAAEQGADRYQSARIHQLWRDEEHPEAIYDESLPRLLRFGGRTIDTMTPLKGLTWVHDRIYEPWSQGRVEASAHFCTHAGIADNPSIKPEDIEELKRELRNNPSQLESRLYGKFTRPTGAVLPWDAKTMLIDLTDDQVWSLMATGTPVVGLDLGKWRFALELSVVDKNDYGVAPEQGSQYGTFMIIDEYFSQNEDTDTRAKGIHDLLVKWRVPESVMIRADLADPKMIADLNTALDRKGSPYMIGAVEARNKVIKSGIDRIENLMNRGAFRVRRGIGAGRVWRLGASTSTPGKPVEGSRWTWEAANWQYPKMADGKIQKDEPDDATADGADMMDATRYAVLSWWDVQNAKEPPKPAPTIQQRLQKEMESIDNAADQKNTTENPYGRILRQ